MTTNTLVIGGTGPTGPHVVEGLLNRGHEVSICHTGNHEVSEIPEVVEHIHTDPFDGDTLAAALGSREFDIVIAMYGRLRSLAAVMVGRTGRLVAVGGMPALRGYSRPERWSPMGLPIPTRENAQRSTKDDGIKSQKVAQTEDILFELHPTATLFRYPYVYGPRQLVPREWPIVRRIVDQRPFIIIPDGGLILNTYGYVENLAHAILLAVDQPRASAGEIFNAADETMLSLRSTIELIADALNHSWDIISLPWELATPAHSLVHRQLTTHRIVSVEKMRYVLGYSDLVPVPEAIARTTRWLVDHPPPPEVETRLGDPFDYASEDVLVEAWHQASRECRRKTMLWGNRE